MTKKKKKKKKKKKNKKKKKERRRGSEFRFYVRIQYCNIQREKEGKKSLN